MNVPVWELNLGRGCADQAARLSKLVSFCTTIASKLLTDPAGALANPKALEKCIHKFLMVRHKEILRPITTFDFFLQQIDPLIDELLHVEDPSANGKCAFIVNPKAPWINALLDGNQRLARLCLVLKVMLEKDPEAVKCLLLSKEEQPNLAWLAQHLRMTEEQTQESFQEIQLLLKKLVLSDEV